MSTTLSQSSMQYRGNTTSGSFYLCIECLPQRYTWQDLKDLVKKEAAHGIWTEMASIANGQTGETGWARLQRREEAVRLYNFLVHVPVQGRRLRVHLFDTSASSPQLIACTCGSNPCAASTRSAETSYLAANPSVGQTVSNNFGYVQQSTAYDVQAPLPYSYPPNAAISASVAPPAMMAVNRAPFVYTQQFAAHQVVNQAQFERHAQEPMYVSSPTGTHVNISQGAIKTEVRGIFVSNVDYKASSKDLQRYFGRAGEIVKCQLQKDPATGKSKGNATVQYAVAKDAKRAVAMFHSEKYMGMRLKVRLDKEPVAVGTPPAGSSKANGSASDSRTVQQSRNNAEPIIVNGSMCQS